jgi:hypothetical protein
MGPDDALDSVLLPVLWELREHLSHLVLIGGWVPQLRTGGFPAKYSSPRCPGPSRCDTAGAKIWPRLAPEGSSPTSLT